MSLQFDKKQGWTVSVSTLVSVAGSLVAVWVFAAPIAQTALADEIKEQVAPLTNAFEIILLQQIQGQKDALTALVFKKQVTPPAMWTLEDEKKLRDAEDTLAATTAALESIKTSRKK